MHTHRLRLLPIWKQTCVHRLCPGSPPRAPAFSSSHGLWLVVLWACWRLCDHTQKGPLSAGLSSSEADAEVGPNEECEGWRHQGVLLLPRAGARGQMPLLCDPRSIILGASHHPLQGPWLDGAQPPSRTLSLLSSHPKSWVPIPAHRPLPPSLCCWEPRLHLWARGLPPKRTCQSPSHGTAGPPWAQSGQSLMELPPGSLRRQLRKEHNLAEAFASLPPHWRQESGRKSGA